MRRGIHCTITVFSNVYCILAVGNWIPSRISRELVLDFDNRTKINPAPPSNNNSAINATQKRADTDQFWQFRDDIITNVAATNLSDAIGTEPVAEVFQEGTTESPKPTLLNDPEGIKEYDMNELLFLSRNNCNLELQINEWEDRKLKIQYEKLQTGMFGRCQISLHGKKGILLAVLISNVQLNSRKSRQMTEAPSEVLRVVTKSHHFDYTLREYRGNEEYYPVILTDSDRVSLILLFNGTYPTASRSSYNLEVFNYYKNENSMNATLQDETHYGYGNSSRIVDKIFLTTSTP